MRKRISCVIHGLVQGVTYRDFVFRYARKLNLSGFVRNESDGTVRVVAEGEEEKLMKLLRNLQRGNWFSKVERVEERWSEATGEFSIFQIIYS